MTLQTLKNDGVEERSEHRVGQALTSARCMCRRWWADLRGAAAVQFIAVLPVFILLVIGLWALFSVYSARDALCDATREASRYLQVEGPRFPDDYAYPDDWAREAADIMNHELRAHTWYELTPVSAADVAILPVEQRRSPQDMSEVSVDELENNWFFVRVTREITNPVAIFLPDSEGTTTMQLSCSSGGVYEGKPIGPTQGPARGPGEQCPPAPPCTPGPPPPTDTPCPPGQLCEEPCPPCEP